MGLASRLRPRVLQELLSTSNLDTLTSPGFIAWYCFLFLCLVIAWGCCFRYCRRSRQHRLQLFQTVQQERNELEQAIHTEQEVEISRIEANVQVFSEQQMSRRRKTLIRRLVGQRLKVSAHHLYQPSDKNTPDIDSKSVEEGQLDFDAGCSICIDEIVEGDIVMRSVDQDKCRHVFHEECMLSWLVSERDSLCPCCRQPFTDQSMDDTRQSSSLSSTQGGSESFFNTFPAAEATGEIADRLPR